MRPATSHSATLSLLAALLGAATGEAYELKRDQTGSPVRWQRKVTFVVDQGLASTLQEPRARKAVDAALAAIKVGSLTLEAREGRSQALGYDPAAGAGGNQNDIVALDEWPYDKEILAVTVVTVDARNHEVLDADIAINAEHRRFGVLPDRSQPGGDVDDLQNMLTHELGHAVGLAHNPGMPEAVMYPSVVPGEVSKRLLSSDDRAGLETLYGSDAEAEVPFGCTTGGGGPSALAAAAVLAALVARCARRGRAVRA